MGATKERRAERYQVVQWATGNIGTKSLRDVIEHPQMDLVGLYVSSPDKVGRDAGELAGLDRTTGVVATSEIADVVALAPDCVLYMRQGCDIDEVCTLLEAGIDIVTTAGEFHHPGSMDPAVRERVEARLSTGRELDPQHGQQPRLHHRGGAAGADVDPAPARPPADRRVRRPLRAELPEPAVRGHGVREGDPTRSTNGGGPTAPMPSGRRCAPSPRPSACPSTRSSPPARWPPPPATSRSPPAPSRPATVAAQRMAVTGLRDGRAPARVQRPLVLHDRHRRRLGPPRHRLARRGGRRLPPGRRAALRHPARADGGDDARATPPTGR